FPRVISDATFHKARQCLGDRKFRSAARQSEFTHVFSGLLKDARGGIGDGKAASYIAALRIEKDRRLIRGKLRRVGEGRRHHVLISTADVGKRGGMMCSFPLPAFEEAMLSLLQEIDPAELLPPRGEANEVVTLSAEVAAIEARIGELEAELEEGGDV